MAKSKKPTWVVMRREAGEAQRYVAAYAEFRDATAFVDANPGRGYYVAREGSPGAQHTAKDGGSLRRTVTRALRAPEEAEA